jgi:predicted secreted acid phosphatase
LSNPKAVIFDIDGTLANTDHRKHHLEKRPKDWDAWHAAADQDQPHEDIVDLLGLFWNDGWRLLICSGRGEELRKQTEGWLSRHAIGYDVLYMRPAGDRRDDSIIKFEMLQKIRTEYTPVMVFDDRARVVQMWRREGLRCLQVAPGDF